MGTRISKNDRKKPLIAIFFSQIIFLEHSTESFGESVANIFDIFLQTRFNFLDNNLRDLLMKCQGDPASDRRNRIAVATNADSVSDCIFIVDRFEKSSDGNRYRKNIRSGPRLPAFYRRISRKLW